MKKAKIIGCGISGITAAILLRDKGYDVELFDIRNHIGGNCYDEKINDITVHKYGSHIFHTNDKQVWDFLNQYTSFNNYIHKVRANTKYGLISIPYNYSTRDQIGFDLTNEEILNAIFINYSERHWGIKWHNLPTSITSRIPVKRNNYDDRYFTDMYQGIPKNGYTHMMQNMLDGIKYHLSVEKTYFKKLIDNSSIDLLVYTGKPDEYFNNINGKLGYRSLRFEHTIGLKDEKYSWDSGSVINECNFSSFNRTADNAIFLNENSYHTVFTRDYPEEHNEHNDPIYPKNFGENIQRFAMYNKLIKQQKKVIFLGRLATYKYLDMWMAIKQVFQKINNIL